MTDSDDDYCVSYIVTMVDVRSCTRPPRSHDQQHISEYPHMSTPPRSPDQTHIIKCTDISIQPKSLYPQSSTNVGESYPLCLVYDSYRLRCTFKPSAVYLCNSSQYCNVWYGAQKTLQHVRKCS